MSQDVKLSDWLRYSGAVISLHLNPLHWWVWPYFRRHKSELGESDRRWEFKFLFVKASVWIDNGNW